MAAAGALTHLYDNVLPAIEDRVWTREKIEEANKLSQRIQYINELRFLDQVQQSLKQGDITAEYFRGVTRMTAQEAEARVADIKRELTKYESHATYKALDLFGQFHNQSLPQVAERKHLHLYLKNYWKLSKSLASKDS